MTTTVPTRRSWQPAVTYGLIAVNLIAFAFSAKASGSIQGNMAALDVQNLALSERNTANGWWWTAVTSGFLHFGLIHLLVNMYSLYILGSSVEQFLGRARYGAIYAVALLGGSASVLWFGLENTITVGASGAIFGLLGAELVLVLRMKMNPTSLLIVIGANVFMSITVPGISLLGHLGGFVAGAAVAAAMVYVPELIPQEQRTRKKIESVGWACTALVAAVVIALVAVRFATYPDPQVYRYR
ncbi:rhomboid family intramembrane serine protease [Tsukamurella sp. 1534]|uniref:rhomboid family intramembrane serine protease n=1 Tax=Tsukamurella sp. 1534 TaxID=1151061 RepID=UPI0002DE4860|nr:rhomboid family intramembrane serine protease [Tsukamurella sp. 1534]